MIPPKLNLNTTPEIYCRPSLQRRLRIGLYHNSPGGGNKRALYMLAKGLIERGHRLDVYTTDRAEDRYLPMADLGCSVKVTKSPEHFGSLNIRPYLVEIYAGNVLHLIYLKKFEDMNRHIATTIDKANYDIVWIDKCFLTSTPTLTKFIKTPSILYVHEPWRAAYEGDIYHRGLPADVYQAKGIRGIYMRLCRIPIRLMDKYIAVIDKKSARTATKIVSNSNYIKEYSQRVYKVPVEASTLGIDVTLFRPMKLERENIVLSIGRLQIAKRHDLVIRAIGLVPENERPELVIITQHDEQNESDKLRRLAGHLKVKLRFEFNISDQALVGWYNRALVLMSCSMKEPLGFTALEAMACGTPVIGVREGGTAEIVPNGKAGLLAESTPKSISSALRRLLNNKELRTLYGNYGMEYIRQFWTWEHAVDRFENKLYTVVNKGSFIHDV